MIKLTVFTAQIALFLVATYVCLYLLKPKRKGQIVIFIVCTIAFALLAAYVAQTHARVTDELTIIALDEKNADSKGTEIDISNIQVDGALLTAYDVSQGEWYWISGRYAWRPASDTRWDGTATSSITLKMPVGWTRTINFYSNPWRGYVEIEKPDGSKEIIDTHSKDDSIHSYQIGRSETRLLLLDGVAQIAAYACLFLGLIGLLLLTIKTGKIGMEEETRHQKIEQKALPGTKKQFLKSLLLLLGLVVVAAVSVRANLWGRVNTKAIILLSNSERASDPITSVTPYEQDVTAIGSFNCMGLQFETFDRKNQGRTKIELKDSKTGSIIETWEFDNDTLTGERMELSLKETARKGRYKLNVSSNNPASETAVAIYMQDGSKCDGALTVGGEKQDNDIAIDLYKRTNIGYTRLILIVAAAIAMAWVAYLLFMIFKPEFWKSAFILLVGFGCIYMFIFPAGSANDSNVHYVTVYEYSNKLLNVPFSSSKTIMMRRDDAEELQRYYSTYHKNKYKSPSLAMYEEEYDEFSLWCTDKAMVDSGYEDLDSRNHYINAVAYFPLIVGVTIGRLLSLGTIPCMFLARLLMLLSVAALISASIKIIPDKKEILLLLSLLPIFLQQITAFSYDGLAFGFAFLFVALCLREKDRASKITFFDYILLVLSTMGLCACRMGMYIVIMALLLLIPKTVLSMRQKMFLFFIGGITVLFLFADMYLGSAAKLLKSGGTVTEGLLVQRLWRIALLFLSTIIENADVYFGGMFGGRMGWNEAVSPWFCVFGFVVLLLLVSFAEEKTPALRWKDRVIFSVPPILVLGFCLLSMCGLESSSVSEWQIGGVQGRYFIPVLPLAFFQIQNKGIILKKNARAVITTIFCSWELIEIYYLMKLYLTR